MDFMGYFAEVDYPSQPADLHLTYVAGFEDPLTNELLDELSMVTLMLDR